MSDLGFGPHDRRGALARRQARRSPRTAAVTGISTFTCSNSQEARPSGSQITRRTTENPHLPLYGSRIVFRSDREGGGVYIVSAFGGEEHQITREGGAPRFSPEDTASDTFPSISVDGTKVAFISTRSGNRDLWLRDLPTGS
jgi:WD40-like Beta Propeller Repeat